MKREVLPAMLRCDLGGTCGVLAVVFALLGIAGAVMRRGVEVPRSAWAPQKCDPGEAIVWSGHRWLCEAQTNISGTSNRIPRFTGTGTLSDSSITDDSVTVIDNVTLDVIALDGCTDRSQQ